MVSIVTGYVRLNSGHRSHDHYMALGRKLLDLGLPTVVYFDGTREHLAHERNVEVRHASLESCWMTGMTISAAPPVPDDPKDTVPYVCVQHQKSTWLADAARTCDVVIWIDFGIFHLPCALTGDVIKDFFQRVQANPPQRITMPSIWPLSPDSAIPATTPAWYCAGGVLVMPRQHAAWFDGMVRTYAMRHLRMTNQATWEVNTWSAVARDFRERFDLYGAGHDESLFTHYPG